MNIETLRIVELTPDPNNARQHDDKNLKAIMGSLKEFGQRKPIVITEAGTIVAGNGTVEAAKRLGWLDIEVVRVPSDWTDAQVKAFAIADNRTAELANWNQEVLTSQLLELEAEGWELAEFGFEAFELPDEDKPIIEDEIPESAPSRVALGDIWQLGNHRLMCGDATDLLNLAILMGDKKAHLVLTDPPYGVSYQSNMREKSKKFDVLANDDVVLDIAPSIKAYSAGWVFVWTSWKVLNLWLEKLKSFGYPTNMIIWDKGGGGIGDLEKTFASDYEVALVWHNNQKLTSKRIGSVWSINKDGSSQYLHPTQKPVALSAMAIEHTTNKGNLVLDIFGGSGSTLIAAEQTKRTCYMMELDPKYCDVIIERWEKLTGQKAELLPAKAD
jgi:site-specific DNA-methyltransferase (adenine-specific)